MNNKLIELPNGSWIKPADINSVTIVERDNLSRQILDSTRFAVWVNSHRVFDTNDGAEARKVAAQLAGIANKSVAKQQSARRK